MRSVRMFRSVRRRAPRRQDARIGEEEIEKWLRARDGGYRWLHSFVTQRAREGLTWHGRPAHVFRKNHGRAAHATKQSQPLTDPTISRRLERSFGLGKSARGVAALSLRKLSAPWPTPNPNRPIPSRRSRSPRRIGGKPPRATTSSSPTPAP